MFQFEGSTSYLPFPHVTTETEPASERSCFTYELKMDEIQTKGGRLFCNMIHHLQSPIAMISPFFVKTRAHCWIILRDNEILALGYSLHKNQVVTCLCSQRTLTSEKTLWYFILLSQSIQILPVAGRWC